MDRQERLTIWQGIEARAAERLANVDADYPAADAGLKAKIKAGAQDSLETAQGFVKYYSE